VRDYFEAVSLGAFSFRDEAKTERLLFLIGGAKLSLILLHLFLVSLALYFPVIFALSRLEPSELYSRLYGEEFPRMLETYPPPGEDTAAPDFSGDGGVLENFNLLMFQNNWGRRVMLPLLTMAFFLTLILQAAFYPLAALCLGLHRMNRSLLSFRRRLGILVFSSTLPAALAAVFGIWLPTVHILVFYLAVIILSFKRSGHYA
jgi:hypothetical protein